MSATQRESQIIQKAIHDPERRPFEDYLPQTGEAERVRLAVQPIPFALPVRPENRGKTG